MPSTETFDALKAVLLVDRLGAKGNEDHATAFADDWRAQLADRFDLTPEQGAWLADVDDDRSAQVTEVLREVLGTDSRSRLVVAMVADSGKPGGLVHELRREPRPSGFAAAHVAPADEAQAADAGGDATSLVIAHCDADCRNWGWGPA